MQVEIVAEENHGTPKTVSLSALADALSVEERKFCEALACNPGITAKDAGIKAGWSEKSAHVTASRALDRPTVQAYLEGLKEVITSAVSGPGEKRIKRKVMKAREVLERLSRIGRASMKPHLAVNADGQVIGTEIDIDHADTLREVTFTRKSGGEGDHAWSEDTVKAKVADPLPALQTLAKYHGLEKASPANNITVNILAVQERLKQIPTEELRITRQLLLEAENAEGQE